MPRYYHVTDNEEIEVALKDFKLICCSCNLVHKINFRIKKGRLFLKFKLDNRSTASFRRKKKNEN